MPEFLRELEARRSTLLAAISALHDMRPGSIVGAVRRCGKPTCHCAQPHSDGHPQFRLLRKVKGKSVSESFPDPATFRQAAEQACRRAKKLGGDRAVVVTAASPASEAQHAWGPGALTAETGDSIPDPIVDEPMAGRIPVSAQPEQRVAAAVAS